VAPTKNPTPKVRPYKYARYKNGRPALIQGPGPLTSKAKRLIREAKELSDTFSRLAYDLRAFGDDESSLAGPSDVIKQTRDVLRRVELDAIDDDKRVQNAMIIALDRVCHEVGRRDRNRLFRAWIAPQSEEQIEGLALMLRRDLASLRPELSEKFATPVATARARAAVRAAARLGQLAVELDAATGGIRTAVHFGATVARRGPGLETAIGQWLSEIGIPRTPGAIHQARIKLRNRLRQSGGPEAITIDAQRSAALLRWFESGTGRCPWPSETQRRRWLIAGR
jgi:hypothetical protein